MKSFSHTFPFLWILLAVILPSGFLFAQSADIRGDLSKSFDQFELVKIDQNAIATAKTSNVLSINAFGRIFSLDLIPRDLRAANYRSEETTSNGLRKTKQFDAATFKGTVNNDPSSKVRLPLDHQKVEGYFFADGEVKYIEWAGKYSKSAEASDFVIYRAGDATSEIELFCDDNLIGKIEKGKKSIEERILQTPQTLRVVEIATEADFELVNIYGTTELASSEILSFLNMFEGVYETE